MSPLNLLSKSIFRYINQYKRKDKNLLAVDKDNHSSTFKP